MKNLGQEVTNPAELVIDFVDPSGGIIELFVGGIIQISANSALSEMFLATQMNAAVPP